MEDVAGCGLPPSAREQAGLPFIEGGCGIRLPSHIRDPARAASVASFMAVGRTQVGLPSQATASPPNDFSAIMTNLVATLGPNYSPLQAWARDWSQVAIATREHRSQGWWADACAEARRRALVTSIGPDGRDAARVASQHGGLSAAWMQVTQVDEGPARISPDEYRLGIRWHLGLPIIPTAVGQNVLCPGMWGRS